MKPAAPSLGASNKTADLVLTVANRCRDAVRRDKRRAILPAPIALPAPFVQICHRRRQADPALRWLRGMIAARERRALD